MNEREKVKLQVEIQKTRENRFISKLDQALDTSKTAERFQKLITLIENGKPKKNA